MLSIFDKFLVKISIFRNSYLLSVIAIALPVVILFWPVFFQNKVIVPGDIPNSDPFFITSKNTVPQKPVNPIIDDQINQFYIWHSMGASSLQADGHIPLWNPYIFSGQPLLANAQSSFFYPPNLLLWFLSPGKVATVRAILNLLVAGVFTFLFCRELCISRKGAILAATAFTLSGPVLVWLGHPHINVLAWLPFLMWAGEKLLKDHRVLWGLVLGSGLGVSILGGHPETTFHVWLVFFSYLLSRLFRLNKDSSKSYVKPFAIITGATIFGITISAIQIIPFIDFLMHSATYADGGRSLVVKGSSLFYTREWLPNLITLVTAICPNAFGNHVDYNYVWPFNHYNYNEQAIYWGTIPLLLAGGVLFYSKKPQPLAIISSLAVLCVMVAIRFPGVEVINHLPIFSMVNNGRLRLVFVFLASIMAAYGFDLIVKEWMGNHSKRSFIAIYIIMISIGLFYFGIIAVKSSHFSDGLQPGSFWHEVLFTIFSYHLKTYLPLVIIVCTCLLTCFFMKKVRLHSILQTIIIGLTILELVVLGWNLNPAVTEADILPENDAIKFMKGQVNQPFRILKMDELFPSNYNAFFNIADVAGYDVPIHQDYYDLYRAQGGQAKYSKDIQIWDAQWPLIDFLNVKYVISEKPLRAGRFKSVYHTDNFDIFENLSAFPRAFMVYDFNYLPDRNLLLNTMINGKADLKKLVLMEEMPVFPTPDSQGSRVHTVEKVRYSNDEVELRVMSENPGILVMSDLHTPDWKAFIDGEETRLYKANYAFRAIYLPKGEHKVRFLYSPDSFKIGAMMTMLGLLLPLLYGLRLVGLMAKATFRL